MFLLLVGIVAASLQDDIKAHHAECKEDHKHFEGDTLAFVTPWNHLGKEFALKYPSKFTYISPVWHEINFSESDGTTEFSITGEKNPDLMSKPFKITPRIIIFRTHREAFMEVLKSEKLINSLCETLVKFAKDNSYDGLVFEFWVQGLEVIQDFGKYKENRSLFVQVLRKIANSFRAANLISILNLPISRTNDISPKEFLLLSEEFDRINLMTYDYSPVVPGPNAPMKFIEKSITKMIENNQIDGKKVLLGIPFYGYDYQGGEGRAVTGKDFIEILHHDHHVEDEWHEHDKEHKFHYHLHGDDCVVYYPTLDMIRERLQWATSKGYGVGIWELGQGLEYFLNLF